MSRVSLMTWKCSDDAKYAGYGSKTGTGKYYGIEMMPSDRYTPSGQEAVFGIVQRRNTLKSWYLTAAFLFALRGVSYGIASRDFVCHKSPNHSRSRLTLWGRSPQSPERRDVYGERYSYYRSCDGNGERKDSSKSPKMWAEYNRICEAKSVGV